jgi:hypothetical protein
MEGKFLWIDLAIKHHLLVSFSIKLTIKKILYQDLIHDFCQAYKIDLEKEHISLKIFLSLKGNNIDIELKDITNPAHETWFVVREHIAFIFNFYSFFDKQCFLLPHLSIGSIHNIQHLFKNANIAPSILTVSDLPFKYSRFTNHTTSVNIFLINR